MIHNFGITHKDGTTAAERLFGEPFPDLFEWIVERIGDLPCPPLRRRPFTPVDALRARNPGSAARVLQYSMPYGQFQWSFSLAPMTGLILEKHNKIPYFRQK